MRRIVPLLAVALLAACGGGTDDDAAAPASAAGRVIEIRETDFALDPATVEVDEAGTYTFRVANDGQATHALEVEGEDLEEETDDIAPGGSDELTVELAAGEYELYCPVGNHKEQGMVGRLVVAGGGGDGGATTESDSAY